MADASYPPVGFHFKVTFSGIGDENIDSRFQNVSGLSMEMETEAKKEGGENRFEYALPVRAKFPALVLKRGLITKSQLLVNWCNNVFNNFIIEPKDLTVSLLNADHEPLLTWNVVQAWPKKWSLSDLNAEQNSIAIETFELQYQYYTLQT
ncbi:MAG: phage tail protein [Mucilaginibacter sp.]|uniref:phage tail protein n=1 Tax=Mucilaginibacter sp. L3T2-6 TaxID=3062491 RepID=UPI00267464F9|nr:phage tail protein [Mucilaginibacter sp. L3T2-6]MDO3641548.1 phage tail protein [Mucilaginibacter sp. L3T2-6]MDV6214042.1 phage tail protein [Mucilaginibacter sp. L3T2-6]